MIGSRCCCSAVSRAPNTELLGAAEMRITALGTDMPDQTKQAVSISYLVELGNGDQFLFDIGAGSLGNLFSLRPEFSKHDKIFASHLQIDHVGDFMGLPIFLLGPQAGDLCVNPRAHRTAGIRQGDVDHQAAHGGE